MAVESTVFVIDDDPAVLHSISSILVSHGLRDECFSSAEAFRTQVDRGRQGCLVVDLHMPGMSGLQLLKQLDLEGAARPTIVITGFAEIETAVHSMKLGAVEFLQKPFSPTTLLEAVRGALEQDLRARQKQRHRDAVRQKLSVLSPDEQKVLLGITRGLTNKQIAAELGLSLRTVQFRRSRLFISLGIKSKEEILALVQQAE